MTIEAAVEQIVLEEGQAVTLRRVMDLLAARGLTAAKSTVAVRLSSAKSKLRRQNTESAEPDDSGQTPVIRTNASKRNAAAGCLVDDMNNPITDVVLELLRLRTKYSYAEIENAFQQLRNFANDK